MDLEAAHRRTAAAAWSVAVLTNLAYAALVPLGSSGAERLTAAASSPGRTQLAVALDLAFRVSLSVGAISLARVVRDRGAAAAVGAALLVAGSLASSLLNAPALVAASAPGDASGRAVLVETVDALTAAPAFLALAVTGLVALTGGATLLLVAVRPAGWAPAWVLVAFLAGGAASLAAPAARGALVAGAVLTGAALTALVVRLLADRVPAPQG